jgi:RNA polymerase sigma-70 factor (ECF subfamily)
MTVPAADHSFTLSHVVAAGSQTRTPNVSPDDAIIVELVDRVVAARDAHAFGELYDLFVERIYRYMHVRTGSHPDAEDLTEQVFVKAWEAIGRFRWQGYPFAAWLYRLAHNAYVDHRRSQQSPLSLNDDRRPLDLAKQSDSAEFGRSLDAELISGALAKLTVDQQQVIVMRFIQDYETQRIAHLMNKREGAIRALQMRALMSLRRVLEEQGEYGSR